MRQRQEVGKEIMHSDPDYKTKKALKEAVASGHCVTAFQPGGMFPSQTEGRAVIEGPAAYHKWYAQVDLVDGRIVKVVR